MSTPNPNSNLLLNPKTVGKQMSSCAISSTADPFHPPLANGKGTRNGDVRSHLCLGVNPNPALKAAPGVWYNLPFSLYIYVYIYIHIHINTQKHSQIPGDDFIGVPS